MSRRGRADPASLCALCARGARQAHRRADDRARTARAFIPHAWHGQPGKPGKPGRGILPGCTGDLDVGERIIAPLRQLSTPIADTIAPMPYPALVAPIEEAGQREVRRHARNLSFKTLCEDALAALAKETAAIDSAETTIVLRVLGGAVGRVPADATAFAHRDTPILAAVVARGEFDTHVSAIWPLNAKKKSTTDSWFRRESNDKGGIW